MLSTHLVGEEATVTFDRPVRVSLLFALLCIPVGASAQASCVDTTGNMCLDLLTTLRGPGSVVDDIFQTSDGRYAPELTFATLLRGVNGCVGGTGFTNCGLPGPSSQCRTIYNGYSCGAPGTGPVGGDDPAFQANSLDWYWTQVRRTDDSGSPVRDGTPGFYYPWTARIMDLGGEANRVVLFPVTDHDPLPCEAFEYAVFLTNNPDSTTLAPDDAPDPNQWNRARMIRAFREGWTRNTAALGAAEATRADLSTFLRDASGGDAIADALATVWALPCGLTFRYVAIQAGNEGNPGPACAFHSTDDELDAVAGLNEDDTAICVDADGDGHRDAACGGGDCDDTDPDVHPGAFERCDASRDLDCRPMEECPEGTVCDTASGICSTSCFEGGCAAGFSCVSNRCIDTACAMREDPCPDGTLCREGSCVAPCDGVVCPAGQRCAGGACLDPCQGVMCPTNQVCIARDPDASTVCGPACTCDELATPLCPDGTACDVRSDSGSFGECVDPGCETATCAAGEICTAGACADACLGVVCPTDQECIAGACVPDLCAGASCPSGEVCRAGACVDACAGVTCPAGELCRAGACVTDPCFGVTCEDGERCSGGSCIPDGTPRDAGGMRQDAGPGGDAGATPPVEDGGCGCRTAAPSGGSPGVALLLLAGLFALRRRRGLGG